MCDYGTDPLDSLILSDPDLKRENVTSTLQSFTFGPQFLVVQTQTFIDENFCFPRQVHRFRFESFEFAFVQQDSMNALTAI